MRSAPRTGSSRRTDESGQNTPYNGPEDGLFMGGRLGQNALKTCTHTHNGFTHTLMTGTYGLKQGKTHQKSAHTPTVYTHSHR